MQDQKILRELLYDSLDTFGNRIDQDRLDRSKLMLRSYLPNQTGQHAPYEAAVMLLGEKGFMDVAKELIEYHGPTDQVLVIAASPGESVVLPRIAYPGDVQCEGTLVIADGAVGGRIDADKVVYGHLAVGSVVLANSIKSSLNEEISDLRVPDMHVGEFQVQGEEVRAASSEKPSSVYEELMRG